MTTDRTAEPPTPTGPGAIFYAGRTIEYAIGRSAPDNVAVWIVNVFPPGDERARLLLVHADGYVLTQAVVDELVFRRIVNAVTQCPEADVAVPARIASWLLGMTEADIAKELAAMNAFADRRAHDAKVVPLEARRHARTPR